MARLVTVLIADQEGPFRQSLHLDLSKTPGVHVMGLADTVREAAALTHLLQPDVVLLNMSLLNDGGPQAAGAELLQTGKVLLLSEPGQEAQTLQLLEAGARGSLVKNQELAAKLAEAIFSIQRGEAVLSPRLAGWMLEMVLH